MAQLKLAITTRKHSGLTRNLDDT